LSDGEWGVLQDFEAVLQVRSPYLGDAGLSSRQIPHAVQQTMSREQTPVLSGAIPAFEMFMTQWERLGEMVPRLKPFVDIGLKWATKYYNWMDRTNAYIISMCEFPSLYFI
jgi:hypothetical protein